MIDDLRAVLAEIAAHDAAAAELRHKRAQVVNDLRAAGWSLQHIADEVGRTKQTVEHWGRTK